MPQIENPAPATDAAPQTVQSSEDTATQRESVGCGACASPEATFFGELHGYAFHRCRGCGLLYMSPRPSSAALRALYDEHYFASRDPHVGYEVYEADRTSLRDKSSRLLAGIEQHVDKGRLLDVGCAHGFLLEVALEHGWQVEAIEPAVAVAERVRERHQVPVHHDLLEAGLPTDGFDVVTMWDVIEHVPDLTDTIAEVRRVLRPGGILSVVTPDVGSLVARLLRSRWEEMQKMPEHIYFFDRVSLARLLEESGFTPLAWGTVGKLMSLDEAASRMVPASPRLFSPLLSLLRKSRLNERVIYLDPRWKMSVVARAN